MAAHSNMIKMINDTISEVKELESKHGLTAGKRPDSLARIQRATKKVMDVAHSSKDVDDVNVAATAIFLYRDALINHINQGAPLTSDHRLDSPPHGTEAPAGDRAAGQGDAPSGIKGTANEGEGG